MKPRELFKIAQSEDQGWIIFSNHGKLVQYGNMVTPSIKTKTALIWNSCLKHSPVIFKSFLSSCGCESAPNASKCHVSDSVDCMQANLYTYGKYTNYASILWLTMAYYIYIYTYICGTPPSETYLFDIFIRWLGQKEVTLHTC